MRSSAGPLCADTQPMPTGRIKRWRSRGIDLGLLIGAIVLIATPFAPGLNAASPVLERSVSVDQRVKPTAVISLPFDGNFQVPRTGRSIGSVKWNVYTTAQQGYKLVISTTSKPALRDTNGSQRVDDFGRRIGDWSVPAGERRFGFSAAGDRAIDSYSSGSQRQWRGFDGTLPAEIARFRSGALPASTTTLWLTAEMKRSLPASARMRGAVIATALTNL